MRHGAGRALLDHLIETYAIVRRWEQPLWLAHAALLHSVYGTDRYQRELLPRSRRSEVSRLAGARAERIAYLFSAVPRRPLLAGTYRWAPVQLADATGDPARTTDNGESVDRAPAPTRDELDALVILHMANTAEQVRAEDGSPGTWLAKVRDWAELLIDSEAVLLPDFIAKLAGFSNDSEARVRWTYRTALRSPTSPQDSADRLALAASMCPVIPEPCIWQACLAHYRADADSASWWAGCGLERLRGLGTAWDKRLSFDQWRDAAEALAQPSAGDIIRTVSVVRHPGELFEALIRGSAAPPVARRHSGAGRQPGVRTTSPPDAAGSKERFQRYIETLGQTDGGSLGAIYPDLASEPWLDPRDLPLVGYLELHYDAIRREILSIDPSSFHRESERIARSGEWDVAFFYERGRRHTEACDACPVTTRAIEGHGAVLTMAGLAYASRMRAGTHIRAHTGPTNLRVRCHLGIKTPEGDCAIRVENETRRWEEGKCIVFNDRFEHEAWNYTDDDRIVLIVDVWHPGLSPTEITLLEGLHRYAFSHARKLNRYWAANAAAAREAS